MEKKTIWHPMSEKPQKRGLICNKAGAGVEFIPGCNWGSLGWKEWAYLDDIIRCSKALDVAIDAFNFIGRPKANGESAATARRTLKKISEIIGGK